MKEMEIDKYASVLVCLRRVALRLRWRNGSRQDNSSRGAGGRLAKVTPFRWRLGIRGLVRSGLAWTGVVGQVREVRTDDDQTVWIGRQTSSTHVNCACQPASVSALHVAQDEQGRLEPKKVEPEGSADSEWLVVVARDSRFPPLTGWLVGLEFCGPP